MFRTVVLVAAALSLVAAAPPIKDHRVKVVDTSFHVYTGEDKLDKPGTFPLVGPDTEDATDYSVPVAHIDTDGVVYVAFSYKAPVNGVCGVFTNTDGPPELHSDTGDTRGAFDVNEGTWHHPIGPIAQDDQASHSYVLYMICVPVDKLKKGMNVDDVLKYAVYSERYEVVLGERT